MNDQTKYDPAVPWEEFGYPEYLDRLESLLKELRRAFIRAGHPDASPDADGERKRIEREIEETALEFVAYAARQRLRAS